MEIGRRTSGGKDGARYLIPMIEPKVIQPEDVKGVRRTYLAVSCLPRDEWKGSSVKR